MTKDDIKALQLKGDDVILIVRGCDLSEIHRLQDDLDEVFPGKRFLLINALHDDAGLSLIPEKEMNAAGWYRK